MKIYSAAQRQKRFFLAVILVILAVLIVVGVGIGSYFLSLPGSATPSATQSTNPDCVLTTLPQETIGISNGCFAFDVNGRPDGADKSQGADSLKNGDVNGALSHWAQALQKETNDAEALIYQEDQHVLATTKSYITLVVATILTGGDPGAISTGRDNLQGAYVAQKEYNDGLKLGGKMQVLLLVANAGNNKDNADKVAQQIVQAARQDKHIVGVMGWPYSGHTLSALDTLKHAHIPMVSEAASSDDLTGKSSFFFRIVPPNSVQATIGADYAREQLYTNNAVVFQDVNNSYSSTLAKYFIKEFNAKGGTLAKIEPYTKDRHDNLPSLLQDALKLNPTPDLIYFAGYAADMSVLLADWPSSSPQLQLMGGDALFQVKGYTQSAQANFAHLNLTAFAYNDEWGIVGIDKPSFFKVYPRAFDPNGIHAPGGPQANNPYGFSRATADAILAYDATDALLVAAMHVLSPTGRTSLTTDELRDALAGITGANAIQGASGQISFAANSDPINKAVVVLNVNSQGQFGIAPVNGIWHCYILNKCNS